MKNIAVIICNYNKKEYVKKCIESLSKQDTHDFDIVGSGTCGGYRQYREMKSIAKAVNAAKKKPVFITGGIWLLLSRVIFWIC